MKTTQYQTVYPMWFQQCSQDLAVWLVRELSLSQIQTKAKAFRKYWLHSILDFCSITPSFCALTFSCGNSSNFTSRWKPTSYWTLLRIPILLRDPFSFKNQVNFHTGSARWPKLLLGNSNSDTPFFLKL